MSTAAPIITDFPAPRSTGASVPPSVSRPFCLRGFVSFLMMGCFLLLLVSGAVLYIAPRGRFVHATQWTLGGLDRFQWSDLHINVSLLFLVTTFIHLGINWSRFLGYLRRRGHRGLFLRQELAAAVALSAAIGLASIASLPPFSAIVTARQTIRDAWEQPVAAAGSTGAEQQRGPASHQNGRTLRPVAGD